MRYSLSTPSETRRCDLRNSQVHQGMHHSIGTLGGTLRHDLFHLHRYLVAEDESNATYAFARTLLDTHYLEWRPEGTTHVDLSIRVGTGENIKTEIHVKCVTDLECVNLALPQKGYCSISLEHHAPFPE